MVKAASLVALTACSMWACGTDAPVVRPIVDTPPMSSGAFPYEGVDTIELSIARAGDDRDLVSATFRTGEPIVLRDVPFGDDLVIHLRGLDGGAQIAYGRTCAINLNSDSDVEPHLYFSRVVKWGPGAAMAEPARIGGHALAVSGGRDAVFVGGGVNTTSIERFSAITGEFVELTGQTLPRMGTTLARIGESQALIVGGIIPTGAGVTTAEVVDPLAAQGFQVAAQAGPALRDAQSISLVDGTVLVVGGDEDVAGTFTLSGKGFVFQIGDGGTLDPPRELASTLTDPRRRHALTRLSDEVGADVLISGGQTAAGLAVATAELYRPLSQVFESVDGALMFAPRWAHQAVRLPGGFVLLVGGMTHDIGGGPAIAVTQLELYDPVQGRFTDAGMLPTNAGVTEFSLTRLPDGRYLMAGGLDASGALVASSFIVGRDPITGFVNVSRTDDLATARAGHAATLLCDGTVLLVGGSADGALPERYNPVETGRR